MQILPQEPQPEPVTYEQLAAALGPFSPPQDFEHGEEFLSAQPRPIPAYLRTGSYARRQRGTTYNLIALGIMCLVMSPFTEGVSHYIHPLAYLHWIGLGLIAIAVMRFVGGLVTSGRYDYVRNGTPVVGRVVQVGVIPTGTSEAPTFQYLIVCEFNHPSTGQHQYFHFPSEESYPLWDMAKYACGLQPGDYVTILALPGKPDDTMRIYGLLGLDPELELIMKNGRPLAGMSPFSAIMVAFMVALVILLIMGAFDLMMFSFPLSGDWKLPTMIAVGGAIAGALLGLATHSPGKSAPVDGQKPTGPSASMFGFGFLGLIGAPILFMVLNAQLDFAQGKFEPIEIMNYWQTTHNFIISDYQIEYRPLQGGETEKKHIRYSQMEQLGDARYGVLDVSPGRFGYPWARGIYPVVWMMSDMLPPELREREADTFSVTARDPGDPNTEPVARVAARPVIRIEAGDRYMACPEVLIEPAARHFRTLPGIIEVTPLSPAEAAALVPAEIEIEAPDPAP